MLYIWCKNLALNITDCVSPVAQLLESRFATWASSFTPHCLCLSDAQDTTSTIRVYVDVGRGRCRPKLQGQMKMVAGLYRDIKRQIVRCSFDSVEEIADEVTDLVNMSQLISPLQLNGNTSLDSFYSEGNNMSITGRPTSTYPTTTTKYYYY